MQLEIHFDRDYKWRCSLTVQPHHMNEHPLHLLKGLAHRASYNYDELDPKIAKDAET